MAINVFRDGVSARVKAEADKKLRARLRKIEQQAKRAKKARLVQMERMRLSCAASRIQRLRREYVRQLQEARRREQEVVLAQQRAAEEAERERIRRRKNDARKRVLERNEKRKQELLERLHPSRMRPMASEERDEGRNGGTKELTDKLVREKTHAEYDKLQHKLESLRMQRERLLHKYSAAENLEPCPAQGAGKQESATTKNRLEECKERDYSSRKAEYAQPGAPRSQPPTEGYAPLDDDLIQAIQLLHVKRSK